MNPTTLNPNANYFQPGQGGNPTFQIPQTSSTINAGTLGQNTPAMSFPTTPTTLDAMSANTSVAQPIATAESIIQQGATATPTEQKQQSIMDKIAGLIGGNQTKTTIQNAADTAAGLPQATSVVNDLNTQLEGLNNQALALQNEAQYTIPNQQQENILNRGITTKAGLAPLTASDLRKNQIKQGAIATQSLTVKSALYGAMGKYSLAKDAADKAATAQYEQQQQQIDYAKAQLDALMPTLNREEKARAAIQQAKLADRQAQIDNAKEDKKTILAMATAALKNNPNNPQAQYAAQQALAESNKEQPNLQVALGLVGQYQQDPLDIQAKIANIAQSRAQTAKAYSDMAISKEELAIKRAAQVVNTVIDPVTGKPTSELKINARDSAKALLDKVLSGTGTSAVGKTRVFGAQYIPGTNAADFTVQFDNLKSLLSLDNIKLLKGQGQVSDAERKLLSDASAKISLSQSDREFQSALQEVYIGLGGTQEVTLTDASGNSQKVNIDANGLTQAKADGLKITY